MAVTFISAEQVLQPRPPADMAIKRQFEIYRVMSDSDEYHVALHDYACQIWNLKTRQRDDSTQQSHLITCLQSGAATGQTEEAQALRNRV